MFARPMTQEFKKPLPNRPHRKLPPGAKPGLELPLWGYFYGMAPSQRCAHLFTRKHGRYLYTACTPYEGSTKTRYGTPKPNRTAVYDIDLVVLAAGDGDEIKCAFCQRYETKRLERMMR
jgi:hypothetical protein